VVSATETIPGIIEIATQAETNTGTDDSRAITALKLQNKVASESAKGIADIINSSDAASINLDNTLLNNDTKIVTLRKLSLAINNILQRTLSFASKIFFQKGVNVVGAPSPIVEGDFYYDGNYYQGKNSTGAVVFITDATQATESTIGVAKISDSISSININLSDPDANSDTKIVTLKKLSLAINNILTRILIFSNKILFQKGINIVGPPPSIVEGDFYYNAGFYQGRTNIGAVWFVTDTSYATESQVGVARIAQLALVNLGIGDDTIVTPIKLQKKILNSTNTASGTGTATLNSYNGVVSYSTPISGNTSAFYTLSNSFVTTNTVIQWSLQHTITGTETPIPCFYQVQAGIITFKIFNNGAVAADGLKIYFTILNPGV